MGYGYISTQGRLLQGSTGDLEKLRQNMPLNFLSADNLPIHNTTAPFTVILTVVEPESETPFRLHMMMPGMYLFSALNPEEYRQQVLGRPFHQHNTYELVYVREGEYYQQIEHQRHKYSRRSCCLLNRNVRHREEYTSSFSIVNISLSPEFLRELLKAEPFFPEEPRITDHPELAAFFSQEFSREDPGRKSYMDFIPLPGARQEPDRIHKLLDRLTELILVPEPGGSEQIRSLLQKILYALSDSGSYTTTPIDLGTGAESRIFARITQRMEQTQGRISREALARELNYSGSYLNRIVHTYTGMSLSQYGTSIAMERAAWLLGHTGMRVTAIAEALSFTDRTHFYRLFREHFAMTPRQYRLSLSREQKKDAPPA